MNGEGTHVRRNPSNPAPDIFSKEERKIIKGKTVYVVRTCTPTAVHVYLNLMRGQQQYWRSSEFHHSSPIHVLSERF